MYVVVLVERGEQMQPLKTRDMLSILLSVLLIHPYPVQAATPAAVLGSISSYGAVSVGAVIAPSEGTLFAGDLVNTRLGSAVIQYKEGARVLLAMDSSAQFTASTVQLQKGQMTFRSASENGPMFSASSLRLEPAAANSSANVILNEGRASVAVTEGAVRVVDPTGVRLADLEAGEARLFAMAVPPAAAAASPAVPAAPQASTESKTIWLLALGVSAVATSLGIAALVRANDASDKADEAAAKNTELTAQITALQGTINTLQGQITTLQGQIAALQSSSSAQQATINSLQGQVTALQATINALQSTITSLQAANSSQAAQITSLLNQVAALQQQIAALQAEIDRLRQCLATSPIQPCTV